MKTETKKTVFKILDSMPVDTDFRGFDLFAKAKRGKMYYPATILRYMRQWRQDNDNYNIVCTSKAHSIYRKVLK